MKKIFKYVVSILIMFIPLTSSAFKLDTHMWVGQQVINDLADDGKLTIKLDKKNITLDVREDVKNAILANQSAYLMGNLGPDAAPDVVVGQMVVHPGVKDIDDLNTGWQTNDWLEYLLGVSETNAVATAYTYGYLGHASADIFAHTYVNQYAGDIFKLADETLVEQRHFVLENYIGKYTPPLKNHLGQYLGSPWERVVMDDPLAEFLRDNLIYNEEVEKEYWKVPAANHLAAYYEFRKGIDKLAEKGIWHDIDVAVTQIVAAYFDIQLSTDEASQIVNETQKVIDALNSGVDNVQESTNKVYTRLNKYDDKVFAHLSVEVDKMQNTEQEWLAKHQEWRRKLLDVENLPNCLRLFVCVPDPKWYNPANVSCGWEDDLVCEATKDAIQASNDVILNAADHLEDQVLGLKSDLIQKTKDVRNESKKAVDSIHNIANALLDLQRVIGADISPIQSLLRGWKSDLDIAMVEYVKATNQAMVNTMNPSESALDPITEWFDCYHMSIIGVPSAISNCQFRDSISNLKESIDNIILMIDEATSLGSALGLPSKADIIELRDNLIDDLVDDLKEKVAEEIVDLLPDEVKEIIELLDLDVNDAVLNQYFTKAETIARPKGLIMIPDMAARVKSEMFLTSSNTFNPEKYAVAYNAVVLAKLALLDKYGYEQLAILSGSTDYLDYIYDVDNIVAQAFGNIDGNHQWMLLPPPRPNTFNYYSPVNYTYSSDRSALGEAENLGFVLWKGDMREKLFRKIFIGPISPGIDTPSLINKTNLVGGNYPYQLCSAHPFPNNIDDRICIAIKLIPILSILLN